jgi:hypothetical protein
LGCVRGGGLWVLTLKRVACGEPDDSHYYYYYYYFLLLLLLLELFCIFISVSIIYFIERVKDISNLEEPKFRSVNKKIKKKDKKKKKNIEALLIAEIEFLL